MAFIEAAYLGREDAIINAIALSDKYGADTLGKWRSIRDVIQGDIQLTGFTHPEDHGISDVRKVLKMFNLDSESGIKKVENMLIGDILQLFEGRTPVSKNVTSLARNTVATKLMYFGTKYDMSLAHVRLGDYFYYGKHPDGVNFKEAFGSYKRGTWFNSSVDFQAQSYLSLGYMYQFGKGCDRNLHQAREAYSKVIISHLLLLFTLLGQKFRRQAQLC